MKTLKFILAAVLTINIVLGLLVYFLNINLFSILQIENIPLQIEEPRYKLNTSSSNPDSESYNKVFFLYDSECKKYGPFEFEETFQEIQNGLLAYCQKEIVDDGLDVLKNIWKDKVTKVNSFIATSWLTDPFSRGAYSYVGERSKEYDFNNLLKPVSNKLFLCGEHTIFKYAGTTHGAYLTGQKVAQSIISIV